MGLLGDSWDDPKTMATLQLAAGLLSPGSFGQNLGKGLLGYQGSLASNQELQSGKQSMQLRQRQIAQLDEQAAAQRRQQEFVQGIGNPGGAYSSTQSSTAGQGARDPTQPAQQRSVPASPNESANAFSSSQAEKGGMSISDPTGGPGDPMQSQLQAAVRAGVMSYPDYLAATRKDTAPIKLGEGETLLAPGTYKPLASNPKTLTPSDVGKLLAEMNSLPLGDPRRQTYALAIQKATTHQPGTTVQVGLQAPITGLDAQGNPVLVQPANKPNAPAQLLLDPRDNKPLRPAKDPNTTNTVGDAKEVLQLLDQAEPLIGKATGSYLGQGRDLIAGAFGASPASAQAAAQLRAIEGGLIAKMPKMSGPQSDKDVLLYRQMAGQIGDATVPAGQKRAAMATIREINMRHAGVKAPAATASAPSVDDLVNQYKSPK